VTLAFWISLIVAAIISKPTLMLLKAAKSRQTISQHVPDGHQVKQGTPTMGGVIPVIAAIVALAFSVSQTASAEHVHFYIGGIILLFGFAVIGFLDDYVVPRMMPGSRGLSWIPKLIMQFVIAGGVCVWATKDFQVLTATIIILFFSNAYNFSDGLDALAGGLLLAMVPGFVVLASVAGSPEVAVPAMALAGGIIPFLFLNAPPARVFMGDFGSLPIGALLGYLTAYLAGQFSAGTAFAGMVQPDPTTTYLSLGILGFMMAAELIPVPIQIASVKLFKRKVFPFTPIHHAFERAGWKETRVVWSFVLVQILATMAAITVAYGSVVP
jgi:phospho-N-acetylmuramoyl-pentapeptide-transferase